jgi:hypothetical protein
VSIWDKAWNWNATVAECRAAYPCDEYIRGPHSVFTRAIDVDAPASVVYRWICQLRVAPYSYDLLDNLGRRSPRRLTPGAERLALGQRFLVGFTVVDFEVDRHVTVIAEAGRLCGFISLTYAAVPTGSSSSRLVVKFNIEPRTNWDRVRIFLLAWGDLIMMRKQFLTLKALAEKTGHEGGISVAAEIPGT